MRIREFRRRGRLLPRLAVLTGVLVLPLGGCDGLLDVEDPDIVTPGSLEGAGEIGRNALYAGAIGDFTLAYAGGAGGGSFSDGIVTTVALFSDEGYAAGTFPTRQEFDQRGVDVTNSTLSDVFRRLSFARRALENAAVVLADADADDPRVAEALALAGYAYIGFAENFCSGVPFSTAPDEGDLEFGEPLATPEIFQRALARFDAALAEPGVSSEITNLARLGKARALVGLGRFEEAAEAAAQVPDDFLYELTHSITSARQESGFAAANRETLRISIANDEGGAGGPFLDSSTNGSGLEFLAADDPRVPYTFVADAFDTAILDMGPNAGTYMLDAFGAFGIPLGRAASTPLASGIEANLIQAEAALRAGDVGAFLAFLNAARDLTGLDLPDVSDPGTAAGRVDLLFRERAFSLFATGQRLSDLRRLIRQYGRTEDQVFPSGAYFKGGEYFDDVNLPIPIEEQNNPNFTQCLDRSA